MADPTKNDYPHNIGVRLNDLQLDHIQSETFTTSHIIRELINEGINRKWEVILRDSDISPVFKYMDFERKKCFIGDTPEEVNSAFYTLHSMLAQIETDDWALKEDTFSDDYKEEVIEFFIFYVLPRIKPESNIKELFDWRQYPEFTEAPCLFDLTESVRNKWGYCLNTRTG